MMKKTLYTVFAVVLTACSFETRPSLPIDEYTAPESTWQKDLESKEATALEMLKTDLKESLSEVVPAQVLDDDQALFRLMPVFTLDSAKCRNFSSEDELLSLLTPDNDRVYAVYTAQNYSIFKEFHTESIIAEYEKNQPLRLRTVWNYPDVAERVRTAISTELPMMAVCVHPGLQVRSYLYCCLLDGQWIVLRNQKKLTDVLKDYIGSLPVTSCGMLQ